MPNVNKVVLIGHLGKDPESNQVGENSVCKFSLAVSEKYKQETVTEWFDVECWGNTGSFVQKYLGKGDAIYLEGKIKTDTWKDKEGNIRKSTKIVGFTVQGLTGKKDNEPNF